MAKVTLEQANTIISAGQLKGREMGIGPLTIVVLDDGGHLVSMQREDKSGILRFEIAFGKAWGGLAIGRSSRANETDILTREHFGVALAAASGGRIIPVAGGVLILDENSNVIGAVGVTGDSSDNDESCAIAGIEAAGLISKV
ncbi:MAG: GlcG protein [Rhodospirillaceae bacterium]|nr:GlcG protein [Rhodospirillaceae bacterium]|tara:strand:- start:10341 stop:10769 length:429 start_codon:yes stop_codon:yes gene_type:complete